MRICSITPRYTPQVAKSFGSNPSKSDDFDSSQVMPPYLPQRSVDLIRNFYSTVYQDPSWLRDKPVEYNGVKFSLVDGPYKDISKAIKAVYPDGKVIQASKYYDGRYGYVIRYAIKESADSEYIQGGLTDLSSKIVVCHENYRGSSLCPSHSEHSVKLADDYLSQLYSDAIEAYNQ